MDFANMTISLTMRSRFYPLFLLVFSHSCEESENLQIGEILLRASQTGGRWYLSIRRHPLLPASRSTFFGTLVTSAPSFNPQVGVPTLRRASNQRFVRQVAGRSNWGPSEKTSNLNPLWMKRDKREILAKGCEKTADISRVRSTRGYQSSTKVWYFIWKGNKIRSHGRSMSPASRSDVIRSSSWSLSTH
ncbi:hypothetical protein J6590_080260 [Homalodisca vitripennis]|nr:hypothetical protein J6590_080260 [Homalodisca vitripennis]